MNNELIKIKKFTEAEKQAVEQMVEISVLELRKLRIDNIDSIAMIINDHEGYEHLATEIWINELDVVETAEEAGVPLLKARWLYQYWRPAAAKRQLLSAKDAPTHDRGRYYSLSVEACHQIRKRIPETEKLIFLVDNNHDYDSLVVDAVIAANPMGQAKEWLSNPPPDC